MDSISKLDLDRIQFVYAWISIDDELGDTLFFGDDCRVPGSIALGGELFRWNQSFEHHFSGYVARSPGVVPRQTIRVQLQGAVIVYEWDHSREIARGLYGDRPIIEIECPAGEIMLLSYRPTSAIKSCWCRFIPTLWPTPLPRGFLSRHRERLGQMVELMISLCLLLACLLGPLVFASLNWWFKS